jgi:hypothetical protein
MLDAERKRGREMRFQISEHALEEMKCRGLSKALIEGILKDPQQVV